MELPFNLIDILSRIQDEPGILVAFAAFHPFVFLLLAIPLWIIKKIGLYTPPENFGMFGFIVVCIMTVGWLFGFASQILLLFMGISGIKMILIYISMYFCITAFVIVNAAGLRKKYDQDQLKKKLVSK